MDDINITFKKSDIPILDQALSQLPYRLVADLIHRVNQQINQQTKQS
jgi:hypothetical protein